MTSEIVLELQRLLSVLCDGELTDLQQARLEELLDADAECRRVYLEYLDMHARLLLHPRLQSMGLAVREEDAAGGSVARPRPGKPGHGPGTPPTGQIGARRRRARQLYRYILVATGTLAASLLIQGLWWYAWKPGPRGAAPAPSAVVEAPSSAYIGTITQVAGCLWDEPVRPPRVGSRLPSCRLNLRTGIARVRIDSGPELVIEGPVELRLESATAATVTRGKLVVVADETATPFELHTPSATLIDLGTEYAVAVGPEGEEVQVFDGEVRRTPNRKAGSQENLMAGQARRYGRSPDAPGQPTVYDPARFVRQVLDPHLPPADPAAGLLAYESFDYTDPETFRTGMADGGFGWTSPWTPGFARPIPRNAEGSPWVINVQDSLVRNGAAVPSLGGSFDYAGFTKYFRRLAAPVRLDTDGVYYLSYLFRRHGPPTDRENAVAVLLGATGQSLAEQGNARQRLNIGVGGSNELFTHLQRVGSRTPLPLSDGATYLLVAKIVAGASNADQVFMRVYGPGERVEREEPGSWSVVGPPLYSNLVFHWLEVHINSKTRQTLDELRVGETWSSVTAPWIGITSCSLP